MKVLHSTRNLLIKSRVLTIDIKETGKCLDTFLSNKTHHSVHDR